MQVCHTGVSVSYRCVSIPGLCQDANHFSIEVGHDVDVSCIGVWSASITHHRYTHKH